MKATRILHDLGQSLWLDNITRNLLKTGVLRRYIDEFSVTGLTSNPTIFDHAIKNSSVTLVGTPAKIASSMAGRPSGVPGILIKTLGRRACACRSLAAAIVDLVSCASKGETSSETQPSTPQVRS